MNMITFLEEVLVKINACEKNAKKELAEGNNAEYIKEMHAKAEILANLSVSIKNYDSNTLSTEAFQFIEKNINTFSRSAKNAIGLKSTWYMAQLLFNEDHNEGDLNNFELFLQNAKAMN